MHRLADHGYYVVNYDARGHGDSDWSSIGDYSLAALASDLRAVLSAVGRPVALAGALMGGMTAFYSLGTDPGIADALVMVDIVLHPVVEGVSKIQNFMTAHRGGFQNLEDAADAVASYIPKRPRPVDAKGLLRNLRLRDDGCLHWHWDPRFLDMLPA